MFEFYPTNPKNINEILHISSNKKGRPHFGNAKTRGI